MLKKVLFVVVTPLILMVSLVFASSYVTNVRPDRIITNSITGDADTIQVAVHIAVGSVEDLTASISIEDGPDISSVSFYYCAIDDILHIYFNKDEVIDYLVDAKIEGDAVVDLVASFKNGDQIVDIEGSDIIEVINPSKKITR